MVESREESVLKAEPNVQLRLLDLQSVDAQLDHLAYQREHLDEARQLLEAQAARKVAADTVIAAATLVSDLEREQTKADLDVEQVRERARKDRELMDSGTINSPKQLDNLAHELESLARRQSDLEDIELEVMERLAGAQKALEQTQREEAELTARCDELEAVVNERYAVIDTEKADAQRERDMIVVDIPQELLSLYDKLRKDHGGVGAAALSRARCEGCRMELPPTDIERIRSAAADEVLRCEECRRILVRTPQSGLG